MYKYTLKILQIYRFHFSSYKIISYECPYSHTDTYSNEEIKILSTDDHAFSFSYAKM